MSISLITSPANGEDVFSPLVFEYAWPVASCNFVSVDGASAGIEVSNSFEDFIEIGDNVRITNGAYLGVYRVIDITPGVVLRLELNTPFIGSSTATGSNLFLPEGAQDFQLIVGYSTGAEAGVKPWQVTDELRVSANALGVYRFDIAGFLRTRFSVTPPVVGMNVPISARYTVRLKTNAAIPDDTGALTAYYGLAPLTAPQQAGLEAVGERPILFTGNQPTLYSLALSKGIINNFVSNPEAPASTTSGAVVNLRLLSCEPKVITWLGAAATSGFTVSPALPSWLQATAVGNNIQLIINPCTGGVADYLSADYNILDYLTGGQLNSVTGCFTYIFSKSGTLFTLNVCVTPVSEIIDVCAANVLNFAWLNQRGGFSSLAVECRYVDGRDFGSDNTVVDGTQTLKRVEFRDVYDTADVRGGVMSKNQLDLLTSLRSSIQAYLYNTETAAFDIPIVINRANFTTYGNRFNQSETRFAFSFRRARQVSIQTQ